MKIAEWKKWVRPLLPPAERWEFRGSWCYRAPVGLFAFGILSEGSAFDTGAYLWQVSMPLFVPSDVVVLSYSTRIGGNAHKFYSDKPAELRSGIQAGLQHVPRQDDELMRLAKAGVGTPDVNVLEAAAYASALLGEAKQAMAFAQSAARVDSSVDWVAEVVDRAKRFADQLEVGGLAAVRPVLERNAAETASALGLRTN